MRFKFELSVKVELNISNEQGVVIGRAEYLEGPNYYQLEYKTADGLKKVNCRKFNSCESLLMVKLSKQLTVQNM